MQRAVSTPTSIVRACLVLAGAMAAGALHAADPIEEVGKAAGELVKTRAETVRLETSWREERALLESTIGGLKERAARLEEKRDHLLAASADERREVADLTAKNAEARATMERNEERLLKLTAELQRLRPFLPPRLSDALEMSYRSLGSATASPGERMQLVMTVLNRCAQFNSTLTHGEEVLELAGESAPKALEVLYWGLSHGYALDRQTNKAWLGSPGPERWQWTPLEGAAGPVAELMAIRLDQADPSLIAVPARLKPPVRP